ncbi:MAG TPA: tail fiber protein [Flavilitoribacter sp.]|nr:tail fiber protein [Flavilitoribacter sp.]
MEPFIGQIQPFGFNFAPKGWALCDGQLQSIAQNSALFSLLGTTYGGDGITTFALPDLRGRTMLHQGHGPGLSLRVIGEKSGTETTTLITSNLPAHSHPVQMPVNNAAPNTDEPANAYLAAIQSGDAYQGIAGTNQFYGAFSTGNTGGNIPFNNIEPYPGGNICIALVGVFPSRR